MSPEDETLKLLEVALTAEIFNQHHNLDINDLTPECRVLFGMNGEGEVKRPLSVSEGTIKRSLGIPDACSKLTRTPVITCDDFGQRIHVTSLEAAARWFIRKGGIDLGVLQSNDPRQPAGRGSGADLPRERQPQLHAGSSAGGQRPARGGHV